MTGALYIQSAGGTSGFLNGTGDGASYSTYNVKQQVWWGLGVSDYTGTVNGFYDARNGFWDTKGVPRVNGSQVWYPGNLDPDGLATQARFNNNVSGGGILTVSTGGNVKWSNRFIVMNTGTNALTSNVGYYDIQMPAANTVITGYAGANNVTVAADGINLASWCTLYAVLGPGGTNSTSSLAIVNYGSGAASFVVPKHWMPLVRQNSDMSTCNFVNGIRLQAGESYNMATGSSNFQQPVNINSTLNVTTAITSSTLSLTQSGVGTNLAMGDDCYLGDVNLVNGFRVTGRQNAAQGYIGYGNGGAVFGFDGGNWTMYSGGGLYLSGLVHAPSGIQFSQGNPKLYSDDNKNIVMRTWDGTNFHYSQWASSGRLLANDGITAGQTTITSTLRVESSYPALSMFWGGLIHQQFLVDSDGAMVIRNGDNGTQYQRFKTNGDITSAGGAIWQNNGDVYMPWAGSYLSTQLGYKFDKNTTTRQELNCPFSVNMNNPYFDLTYGNVRRWRMTVDGAANLLFQNGDNGVNSFYIRGSDGAIWSSQLGGFLSDWVLSVSTSIANSAAAARLQRAEDENWYTRSATVLRARGADVVVSNPGGGYGAIEIRSQNDTAEALQTFHNTGRFAMYLGLNGSQLGVGGWSYGNGFWRIHTHQNINPLNDMRMAYAGDQNTTSSGMTEPWGGAAVTGYASTNGSGYVTQMRWRYMQKQDSYGNWYTIGYV